MNPILPIYRYLVANKDAVICGIRFATACLLAYIFYLLFDLQFGYWAVVTVSAIMQPYLTFTKQKGWLRLFGTLVGVAIGSLGVLIIIEFPHLLLEVFFAVMFVTAWLIFFNRKYTYLGIVCGITVIIIITTYNQYPALLYFVAIDRTIDVMAGIVIAWLCSILIFPTPEDKVTQPKNVIVAKPSKKIIMLHSVIMAISTTAAMIPWFMIHYSGGFWAPISCLFIVEENIDKTQEKGFKRFLAHVVVVLVALIFFYFLNSPLNLGIALVIGMFLFGFWMIKPLPGFDSSMANTMAIAYSIVLLISPGQTNTLNSALARFFNTILGIGIGLIIVKLIHMNSQLIKDNLKKN